MLELSPIRIEPRLRSRCQLKRSLFKALKIAARCLIKSASYWRARSSSWAICVPSFFTEWFPNLRSPIDCRKKYCAISKETYSNVKKNLENVLISLQKSPILHLVMSRHTRTHTVTHTHTLHANTHACIHTHTISWLVACETFPLISLSHFVCVCAYSNLVAVAKSSLETFYTA